MKARFSLDGVRVEYRVLAPRRPFTLRLPLPPAAEAMFATLPGRGRFAIAAYADWQDAAALKLVGANPPRFKGGVWIAIRLEDGAPLDDRARPLLALLTRERVIESLAAVRELQLRPGTGLGVHVEVRSSPFGAA